MHLNGLNREHDMDSNNTRLKPEAEPVKGTEDVQTPEDETPENQTSEDKTSDDKTAEDQTPEVNKSSNSSPPPSVVTKRRENSPPIDRGYAWVVVFACLFSNILCLGLQRAYGILFVEFLHLYNLPVGVTSLVMAIQSAFMSVSAFLTQTVMLSLLSERQTMIIGGLCGGLGLILSYFASTLLLLILTQSVIMGSANGMVMGPTMVIVGKYFNKRRSFAMARATLGGNLGSMIMPLFTEALLKEFGVRGTFLVLGATFLNIMVCAGLLRPLEIHGAQEKKKKKKDSQTAESQPLNEKASPPQAEVQSRSPHEQDSLRAGHLHLSPHLCISTPDLFVSSTVILEADQDTSFDLDKDQEGGGQELQPFKNGDTTAGPNHVHLWNHYHHHHSGGEPEKVSSMSQVNQVEEKKSSCGRFLAMFDFSLFKLPPFLLVVAATSLGYLPASTIGMYLPAMAADKGVVGQRAALLLTIFGGCGIFSRLGFGYLADVNCMRRAFLMALLMMVSSVAGLFTPLYNTYPLLVFFSVVYGVFGIVFFSLVPVVIVDLVGLSNMSKTLGFVQLFQGAVLAVSHPIIGNLRDATGQYHASYYFLSAAGLTCSFLLLFTPLVSRRRPESSSTEV